MATLGGEPSQRDKEKERLCPSCRMSISALATRCHYCGEEVARPKVEDRKLTIQDLGGHSQNTFQVSGSVLNALEAFRMEEGVSGTAETPKPDKRSPFSKRNAQAQAEAAAQPEQKTSLLDELGLAPKPVTPVAQRHDPNWVTKMGVLGGFIAAIVILFFGGVKGFAMISDYLEQRRLASQPEVINRAPELIAQGNLLPALEAAVEAHKAKPDSENQDILAQVRGMIAAEITSKLDSPQWKLQDIYDASTLAQKAAAMDPSNRMVSLLLEETNREIQDYSLVLKELDYANKTATFSRTAEGRPRDVQVKESDEIWGRFDVISVQKDAVILIDKERTTAPNVNRRIRVAVGNVITLTTR